MEKVLIYLPYSEFIDSYEHKALGGIPIGFTQAGYDTSLIVGIMKSDRLRKYDIKIFETGNLDDKYIIEDGKAKNNKIIPRIKNFLDFSEYKTVYGILIKQKPDILLAYNNSTLTPLILLRYKLFCRFHKIKSRMILKLDNDGSDIEGISGIKRLSIGLYYSMIGHVFDDVITETSCGLNVFRQLKGISQKVRKVPNTVFSDFLCNEKNRYDKIIISVSRIKPVKGIERLIESFKLLANKYPDWNLKIIGKVEDNEYYSHLVEIVNSYRLNSRILFTGEKSREELIDIYNSASIYCLFSEHESFAISRLEAIAMGLYVITTDAGCAADLAEYGIHIMDNNTPECGSEYIEKGIKALDSGDFNKDKIKLPSYREIAMMIVAESGNPE